MRKCINPLWYFHPSAAKYRGLCEADAGRRSKLRTTSIAFGVCRFFNCAALLLLSKPKPLCWVSVLKRRAAYAEETKHNLLRFPGAGSKYICRPLPKNRTVVFRQSSLGSAASFVRARDVGTKKVWARHGRDRRKDLPDAGGVGQLFTGCRSRRWYEIRATT